MRILSIVCCGTLAATLCSGAGCKDEGGVTVLHDLHQGVIPGRPTATEDFYALPFPNDLRKRSDGTVDLSAYPRPDPLVAHYLTGIDGTLRDSGNNASVYFRLDGPIDPTSLPKDEAASIAPGATAFIVDVTPGSPTYGKRTPVRTKFQPKGFDFIGPNWVAVLPGLGFPLRKSTTYAAILTTGLVADGGVRRARDLDRVLDHDLGDPQLTAAAKAYAPLLDYLATKEPALKEQIVGASVFTTGDPTKIMFELREAVLATPAPVLVDLAYDADESANNTIYTGHYDSPNFQEGEVPYLKTGGAIHLGADGKPAPVRTETLRVAMSIPKGTMPAAGWPVVMSAHGTGGSWKSFLGPAYSQRLARITAADGTVISQMATISIDQVLHGARVPPGTDPDTTYVNLQNLVATHATPQQGALDDFQLLRLVKSIDVAAAPTTGAPIKFDPSRVYFIGHSQGALTGALFLAAEPGVRAAVLSGAGANLIDTLLTKTIPIDGHLLLSLLFSDEVDEFHPFLNLVQAFYDSSEPANYGLYYFLEPPAGFAPKSIMVTLGLIDRDNPVRNIKAQAVVAGVHPANPQLEPIAQMDLLGRPWADPPIAGNVAGGLATGVVCEYEQLGERDGHYVLFDIEAAYNQAHRFLAADATTGLARLDPP